MGYACGLTFFPLIVISRFEVTFSMKGVIAETLIIL